MSDSPLDDMPEAKILEALEQISTFEKQFVDLSAAHVRALKDIAILATSISSIIDTVMKIEGNTNILADYDWSEVRSVISRYRNH
tara:strand:+ start:189 stop:443 length:255 start_codon:yes stop_codon:yes gene_type:complete